MRHSGREAARDPCVGAGGWRSGLFGSRHEGSRRPKTCGDDPMQDRGIRPDGRIPARRKAGTGRESVPEGKGDGRDQAASKRPCLSVHAGRGGKSEGDRDRNGKKYGDRQDRRHDTRREGGTHSPAKALRGDGNGLKPSLPFFVRCAVWDRRLAKAGRHADASCRDLPCGGGSAGGAARSGDDLSRPFRDKTCQGGNHREKASQRGNSRRRERGLLG